MSLDIFLKNYNKDYLKFYWRSLCGRSLPFYSLIFQVTNTCNSKCVMCFNWKNLNKNSRQELNLEEINKFASHLGNLHTITLGGGEPFLRNDLTEIVKCFSAHNHLTVVAIPTNCLLPDKILAGTKSILNNFEGIVKIGLSLDGLYQDHDDIRGVSGNFGKFLETYQGLATLKKTYPKLKLRICTTVFNQNADKIIEVLDYVEKNLPAADFHGLELLKGDYNQSKVSEINPEKLVDIIDVMRRGNADKKASAKRAVNLMYYQLSADILKHQRQTIPCRIAAFYPVVDATGNVYPCENRKTVGNLRDFDYDLVKIWQSDPAKQARASIKNKECYCTHSCYQNANIFLSPKMIVKIIRNKY